MERQRYCRSCATAANRRSRDRRREAINERRRAREKSPQQRQADNARAAIYMAIRRGRVRKQPFCEALGCLETDLFVLIADPAQPRVAEWFCRAHHAIRKDEVAEARVRAAAREAAALRRADFDQGYGALPAHVRAALEAYARKSPFGFELSPEAPLYRQRLVAAFTAYKEGRVVAPGSLLRE
jgi:hypothetical protein